MKHVVRRLTRTNHTCYFVHVHGVPVFAKTDTTSDGTLKHTVEVEQAVILIKVQGSSSRTCILISIRPDVNLKHGR